MKKIIVGSRESKLAVVQSMTVVDHINGLSEKTGYSADLLTMKTTGDKILDRTLDKVGGKGLFVKELDLALKEKRSDISVHSLKDVPMELDPELPLIAFSMREDPRDVLVLPESAVQKVIEEANARHDERSLQFLLQSVMPDPNLPIGSSSLRRVIQLQKIFPDYKIEPVRGNLQTRLKKLDEGQYGALVLAAAGLRRLGLEHRISRYFTVEEMIPAAGQGIIAVQGRAGEDYSYLEGYADKETEIAALCERAYVRELNGGCTSPVCAHAQIKDGKIFLSALYYDEASGKHCIGNSEGDAAHPEELGIELARRLQSELKGA